MLQKHFYIIYLVLLQVSLLQAQSTITVYPEEFSGAIKNPLKGFRDKADKKNLNNGSNYTTIVRDYIKWNEIETDSTDGVEKIINFCNKRWQGFEKSNMRVIPRVYILWDAKAKNGFWPSDIKDGDWYSDQFKDRIVKLIAKLGAAWDNDPRVAWVQTGLIGYWGEQEKPVSVSSDGWAKRLGDAYANAFKNKKLLVRNQKVWDSAGHQWGTYWDSYAHPAQEKVKLEIRKRNNQKRYLTEIIEGETAYDWGKDKFFPKYGNSPTSTCNSSIFTNNLIDVIKDLHCTGLGWVSGYKLDGSENTNVDSVKANASKIQEAFGYNYVITKFSCNDKTSQGKLFKISASIKNNASAPFYQNWPLVAVLIDEITHEIVYKEQIKNVDIREWLPGDDYSYETRSYSVKEKEYIVNASIKIPKNIKNGNYMIGLSILEPFSQTPGIFFDIKNFLSKSQTQPLCRIGVGQALSNHFEIDKTIFGSPLLNDNRSYSLTQEKTALSGQSK
jgi:hypothetical protein